MNVEEDLIEKYTFLKSKGVGDVEARRLLRLRTPMFGYLLTKLKQHTDIVSRPNEQNMLEYAIEVSRKRPTPEVLIDQCPLVPEDMVRRALIIYDRAYPLKTKEVLFVGDDDLVSIILLNYFRPKTVALVDVDPRIIETVKSLTKKEASLETYKADIISIVSQSVSDPLHEKLFDIFVTDPPYTEMGYRYFLSYALRHLALGGLGFIAVPYMSLESWTDELLYLVEELLIQKGLLIEEVLPGSAIYQHEDGVVSSTLIVRKVTNERAGGDAIYNSNKRLYTLGTDQQMVGQLFADQSPNPSH